LNLSDFENLEELDCSQNQLTSVDFLKKLPNPKKLKILTITNNNIEPTSLKVFKPLTSLKRLVIGTDSTERMNSGLYNRFYGNLESLEGLSDLYSFRVENTMVTNIEYFSSKSENFKFKYEPFLPKYKVNEVIIQVQGQIIQIQKEFLLFQQKELKNLSQEITQLERIVENSKRLEKVFQEMATDDKSKKIIFGYNITIDNLSKKLEQKKEELKRVQEREERLMLENPEKVHETETIHSAFIDASEEFHEKQFIEIIKKLREELKPSLCKKDIDSLISNIFGESRIELVEKCPENTEKLKAELGGKYKVLEEIKKYLQSLIEETNQATLSANVQSV